MHSTLTGLLLGKSENITLQVTHLSTFYTTTQLHFYLD